MILQIHDLIENDSIEIKEKEIIMSKEGDLSYTNVYKKGKITKNFLKTSDLVLEIYIITRNISIKNGKIDLEYNIYNDSDAMNLVSSYSINIEI